MWLGDGWCGGVVLLGGVRSPDGAVGVVVDFEHREVGHESVGRGAVPVIPSWLGEAAIAVADDLNRAAAALAAADPVEDVDRLAVAETRLLGSYPDAGAPVIPVRSPIDVLRSSCRRGIRDGRGTGTWRDGLGVFSRFCPVRRWQLVSVRIQPCCQP